MYSFRQYKCCFFHLITQWNSPYSLTAGPIDNRKRSLRDFAFYRIMLHIQAICSRLQNYRDIEISSTHRIIYSYANIPIRLRSSRKLFPNRGNHQSYAEMLQVPPTSMPLSSLHSCYRQSQNELRSPNRLCPPQRV